MKGKTDYKYYVKPQDVDFTKCAKIFNLMADVLNTAGDDAHNHGFGIEDLNKLNQTWVLSRMSLEIDFRPLHYTNYTISTWVSGWERFFSTRNFILYADNGAELGRSVTQWAIIDLDSRRPVNLIEHSLCDESKLFDETPPTTRAVKLKPITPTYTSNYKVAYSDTDFNNHFNSINYLRIVIDTLPFEFIEYKGGYRIDMHFLNECRYGEVLTIVCELNDKKALFEILRDDNTVAFRASVEMR